MKLKYSSLLVASLLATILGAPAYAITSTVVTFETPGASTTYQGNTVSDVTSITNGIPGQGISQLVSGAPSVYVSAGTAQTITTNEATFNGGVLLGLATFFPAQTFASGLNVYGTADFGIGLQNNLSFTTTQPTNEISFALFNGETFTESYNIATVTSDGVTHNQTVSNIGANWASGYAIVDLLFPDLNTSTPTSLGINSVTITSALSGGSAFDFLIDSIVFNGVLPGATSPDNYVQPKPTYIPSVDPASPIIVKAPEVQLPDNKIEVVDYGTDQVNDKNIEARVLVKVFNKKDPTKFEWELEDPKGLTTVTLNPVPESETYAMMLAGLGVMGFVARRRRIVS